MLSHRFPPQSGEERRGGGHGEDPEKGRRPHQEGNRVAHSLNLGKREPEKPCQDGATRQDAGLPDGEEAANQSGKHSPQEQRVQADHRRAESQGNPQPEQKRRQGQNNALPIRAGLCHGTRAPFPK